MQSDVLHDTLMHYSRLHHIFASPTASFQPAVCFDAHGKFKYSEDGLTIRLDTKKSKDAFIMLMNDAFLHSELSKRYYEAKAKDNIS